MKQDDPFLKVSEVNDRTIKGKSDTVYSLRDLSFQVNQGEALGIIGNNGAGKSTLLKILSRVTTPTQGRINIKGRVASLLEVGTGFHPELTGRENIYLNGAILGMRKREIDRKLDEIIEFSGVERYIDTPVKRYSSGMYVRLAFAVAAHLESEILIVDEVLAVGDAEFQKRCLGKMNEVSKGEGRTVLFVSHNMASIKQLCNNAIYLKNGFLNKHGEAKEIIDLYANDSLSANSNYLVTGVKRNIHIKSTVMLDKHFAQKSLYSFDEEIFIQFEIEGAKPSSDFKIGFSICDTHGNRLFTSHSDWFLQSNYHDVINVAIPKEFLLGGGYVLDVAIFIPNGEVFDFIKGACNFQILDTSSNFSNYSDAELGSIFVNCNWNMKRI